MVPPFSFFCWLVLNVIVLCQSLIIVYILILQFNFREYLKNIETVDAGIQKTVEIFERFYSDHQTAYIFTSDHGMTDWGEFSLLYFICPICPINKIFYDCVIVRKPEEEMMQSLELSCLGHSNCRGSHDIKDEKVTH